MLEPVEGGPVCKLSAECQDMLRKSSVAWGIVKQIAKMLGDSLDVSPAYVLESTITDHSKAGSPCPQHIRDEVRANYKEALEFMSGLMGAM